MARYFQANHHPLQRQGSQLRAISVKSSFGPNSKRMFISLHFVHRSTYLLNHKNFKIFAFLSRTDSCQGAQTGHLRR